MLVGLFILFKPHLLVMNMIGANKIAEQSMAAFRDFGKTISNGQRNTGNEVIKIVCLHHFINEM
jgi:hypothetical protein